MVHDPEFLQVAAGIDFDSIAPFVFVILIVVSQLISALKKKGAKEDEEPDVDALERARQIREEIRRKIEERRQQMEPGTTRPVDRPRQVRPSYDPTRPDGQVPPAPRMQMEERPAAQQQPAARSTSPAKPLQRRAETHQSSMQQQLVAQRRRLEAARQQQRDAHEKAKRMVAEAGGGKVFKHKSLGVRPATKSVLKSDLLSGLRDRNGLKKAVLFREILGKPLGLR